MFDLSKWESDHPAVRRFAQQLVDVLESVAEHLIGQASAAVSDALAGTPSTSGDSLSATESVSGVLTDAPAAVVANGPVQPAADAPPAHLDVTDLDPAMDAAGASFMASLRRAQQLVDAGATEAEALAAVGLRQRATLTPASLTDPAAPAGPLPSPIGDSGPAGVVAGAGQDVPVTGEPAAAGVPGADMPVTHNVDPADVVGADSHNAPTQQ